MIAAPKKSEIDHHTIKLIVGVIAISLASVTSFFSTSTSPLTSISESYYAGDVSRNLFVGFLFAITAFLLAYNGLSRRDMILSKVAALAAFGVAMFPCGCDGQGRDRLISSVHSAAAVTMFLILAYFCYTFWERARTKPHTQAKLRVGIYALCGIAMLLSIIVLVMDALAQYANPSRISDLKFYGEAAGLIAFGISWLTASRILPVLTHPDERLSLFA